MKIFALYSIKGGVGKTATCVNLAYLAAESGHPTLLCDLDPQGAASYYFRIRASKKHSGKKILKSKKKVDKNIKGTDFENLDLLPSDLSYRNLDLILNKLKKSKNRLKDMLSSYQADYDFIFLDCPPNITLVSENVFQAAQIILVPVIPTSLSVLTHEKLTAFFKKYKYQTDKLISFFSMVEKRKKMHQDIMAEISQKKEPYLKTIIPYAADIEKMGLHRKPIFLYRGSSPAAEAYRSLWRELTQHRK